MTAKAAPDDPSSPLVPSLIAASRGQARLAMELHADPFDPQGRLRAAMAVGVAVELALKAAVAAVLPSLLADKGDTHTQLFLMGRPGLPGRSYSDVRTISGTAALQVVSAIHPQLGISQKDVQAALNLRNSAVHLALLDPTELAEGVRAMAVCIDRLLPELGVTRSRYWGEEFEGQVVMLIEEVMDAREIRVAQARSSALVHLARLKAFGAEAFEAIRETLDSEGLEPEDDGENHREPQICPVCSYGGWLSGVIERSDLQMEDGEPDGAWVDLLFVAREFRCGVCGLVLWNQELPLVGLPATKQLSPDEDPWELRELYREAQAEAAWQAMRDQDDL